MARKKKNKLPDGKNKLEKNKNKLPDGKNKFETIETLHKPAKAQGPSLSKLHLKGKPSISAEGEKKEPNDSPSDSAERKFQASTSIEKALESNQSLKSAESKNREKSAIRQENTPQGSPEKQEKIDFHKKSTEKKKGRFRLKTVTFLIIFGFGSAVYYLAQERMLNIDKLKEQVYYLSNKISSLELLSTNEKLSTNDRKNINLFQDGGKTTIKKHHEQVQVLGSLTKKLIKTPTVLESNREDIKTDLKEEISPPAPIVGIPDEEIVMGHHSGETMSGKSVPTEESTDKPVQIAFIDDSETTKKYAASGSAHSQQNPIKKRELSPGAQIYVDFVEKAGEIVFNMAAKGANASIDFFKKFLR